MDVTSSAQVVLWQQWLLQIAGKRAPNLPAFSGCTVVFEFQLAIGDRESRLGCACVRRRIRKQLLEIANRFFVVALRILALPNQNGQMGHNRFGVLTHEGCESRVGLGKLARTEDRQGGFEITLSAGSAWNSCPSSVTLTGSNLLSLSSTPWAMSFDGAAGPQRP